MVIAVTLNPCIDRTIEIERFQYGGTNKVLATRNDISGKGINVNLVLQHLGVKNMAIGFDCMEDSRKLRGFLEQAGCPYVFEEIEGGLRVNVKIFDRSSQVMSEFNDKGVHVDESHVERLMERLLEHLDHASVLVVDGSVPPGVPSDIYERMIREAKSRGVKTILDASGELLRKGIQAKPFLIKPNADELGAAYGVPTETLEDIVKAAEQAVKEGVSCVCVSRGDKGAVFITRDHIHEADPVSVEIRGIQGAGDSMVAGFCCGLEQELEEKELFRYAVACATGSLLHPGTQLCEKQDVEEILPKVVIREIEK